MPEVILGPPLQQVNPNLDSAYAAKREYEPNVRRGVARGLQ